MVRMLNSSNERDNWFVFIVSDLGLLRGVTERDKYEEQSREIRFNLYKDTWNKETMFSLSSIPCVLFGHHSGDIVENVISNAMKGKTIVELSGMQKQSLISGVIIQRPMLDISKDLIFDFAHCYGVPYFKVKRKERKKERKK